MNTLDRPAGAAKDWSSPTEIATQLYAEADEQASVQRDIGKNVGQNTRELFVVCDPAEALRQQFDHLDRAHVALHGVGTLGSKKLLAAIAQTAGWPLRRLVVRRQGFGNTLAELHYLDCPAHDNKLLRLYATEVEIDPLQRGQIVRLLLGRALMSAVLIEDLPERTLAGTLQTLQDDLLAASGACRHVVFLPRTRSDGLHRQVEEFKRRGFPQAEITPATAQPAALWALLAAAWNRAHPHQPGGNVPTLRQIAIGAKPAPAARPAASSPAVPVPAAASAPASAPASAAPLAATSASPSSRAATPPAPATAPPAPPAAAAGGRTVAPPAAPAHPPAVAPTVAAVVAASPVVPPRSGAPADAGPHEPEASTVPGGLHLPEVDEPMQRFAAALQKLAGVRGGCVFEMHSLRVLAELPGGPEPAKLALQGRSLVNAAIAAGPVLGQGAAIGELLLTLGNSQLLLRPVPRRAGVMLHLVVERQADLAALRQGIKLADVEAA